MNMVKKINYLLFFLILLVFFTAHNLKNITAQGTPPDVPGDPDQGTPPPPNGTGINPPNETDYTSQGEHDWQCTDDDECNSGLCCVMGGSQPNKCHPITELHGGRCESTSESGGIPRGSHNWPCQNNSQCNQGLCCVKNGTMSNRCHPVWDSLHGGACMVNNLLPNNYTPSNLPNNYIPPGNNNNSAGGINVSNSKKIIIIILIIFAVIAAAFAIWVFIYLRRKKIKRQVSQTPKTDEYKVNFVQGDGTQPARFTKRQFNYSQ